MCGADLSDVDEEVPRVKEADPRKKTGQDKAEKRSPSYVAFPSGPT